jgi:hypothetical protein
MGCMGSKPSFGTVDDSVHVMLQHDKKIAKKKGQPTTGYVPRAEHPLLQNAKKKPVVASEDDGDGELNVPVREPEEEKQTQPAQAE